MMKVCPECRIKKGVLSCEHWEQWLVNVERLHNWVEKSDGTKKVSCTECGQEATFTELATGAVSNFNCPRYKIQRPIKKPDDSSPRGYRLWCAEHKPKSATKMPRDPRAPIQPGEAKCEEPGCDKPASWEF